MRITTSIPRLCLYAYLCLWGLQPTLAHDPNKQAVHDASSKVVGPATNQGNHGAIQRGNGHATDQVTNTNNGQSMAKSKEQVIGDGGQKDGRSSANAQKQDNKQAEAQKKNQTMTIGQTQAESACNPQIASNDKTQDQKCNSQAAADSENQVSSEDRNGQNNAESKNFKNTGQKQGQIVEDQVLQVTNPQSLNKLIGEAETVAQNLEGGNSNSNQAAPAAAAAAPPPNNAVESVALPPNNAVVQGAASTGSGTIQQMNGGQGQNQSTNAQTANKAGSNDGLANSALFSGVASPTSSTGQASVAAAMSAMIPAGTGTAGADSCDSCQCNCPMAGFAAAQQVGMMATMAAPPPQSTLHTVASANVAQANAQPTTTPSLTASSTLASTTVPTTISTPASTTTTPPGADMPVQQAQANAASPQAQGATAGGVAAALPTNLSTFVFQSAVTVPLGKRREARATRAFR